MTIWMYVGAILFVWFIGGLIIVYLWERDGPTKDDEIFGVATMWPVLLIASVIVWPYREAQRLGNKHREKKENGQ